LSKDQYAYRKGGLTTNELISLINNINTNLEQYDYVRVLLVDFSKAFDKVDHISLLKKLSKFPINTNIKLLIKDFLTNRYQRVIYNEQKTGYLQINQGVPQGTIFGPMLFSLFLNDLAVIHNKNLLIKYADDTTIVVPCRKGCDDFNSEVDNVITWSKNNYMEINLNKTKEIVFNFKRAKFIIEPHLNIEQVVCAKLLGIYINNDMKWQKQVDYICKKSAQRLYLLNVLRRLGYTTEELILLAKSIIISVITYALSSWGGLNKNRKQQVQKILNRVRKITAGGVILELDDLVTESVQNLMYAIHNPSHMLHSLLPEIRPQYPTERLRTRSHNYLKPKVKTNRLMKTFPFRVIFS
jgi:hypothetical protein